MSIRTGNSDGSRYAERMRRWSLVGRAAEFARLLGRRQRPADRGRISAARPGVGKSRLLAEAVAALPADQHAVHLAAANIASSGPAVRRSRAGAAARSAGRAVRRGTAALGASTRLHADAAGGPIVLAVDDAHLLDAPSAALVHLLVREGATLLGTLRSGRAGSAADQRTVDRGPGRARRAGAADRRGVARPAGRHAGRPGGDRFGAAAGPAGRRQSAAAARAGAGRTSRR